MFYILRFNYSIADFGFIGIFVWCPKGREIRPSLSVGGWVGGLLDGQGLPFVVGHPLKKFAISVYKF